MCARPPLVFVAGSIFIHLHPSVGYVYATRTRRAPSTLQLLLAATKQVNLDRKGHEPASDACRLHAVVLAWSSVQFPSWKEASAGTAEGRSRALSY